MFIQIMSIIRNNAYIIYHAHFGKNSKTHKAFTLEIIKVLRHSYKKEKNLMEERLTRKKRKQNNNETPSFKFKVRRCNSAADINALWPNSMTNPKLHIRSNELTINGAKVKVETRGTCVICSENKLEKKSRNEEYNWKTNTGCTNYVCVECSKEGIACYLCKNHFNDFHQT